MGKIRNAFGCGIAPLRPLLGLIAAALLAGAIACGGSDLGVVAVVPSDEGLAAITLGYSPVENYKFEHSSQDGGLTWSGKNVYGLKEQIDWQKYLFQAAVDTPRGSYRIDGADIQLQTSDDEYQTVYSAAHLLSPSNRWLQYQKFDVHKNVTFNPSSGPGSITYDPSSGNVIVSMGILGVVVGTPDGSWTTVAVGRYHPINFSGISRVGELLSSFGLWSMALAFPFSMIAIVFAVVSAISKFPPSLLGGFTFIFVRLPLIALSALLSVFLLVDIGIHYSSNDEVESIFMISFFLSLICSLASMIFSAEEEWVFSRRPLAVTICCFAAMMVFVLLPFLAWAQLGEYLSYARAVSVALCAAVALGLIVYCVRTSRKYVAPRS